MQNIHVCLFIDPNTINRLHAFQRVFQVHKLGFSYMDLSRIFMASSQSMESGLIIASLHVVDSSLSNNNDLISNLTIWFHIRPTRFNRNLDLHVLNLWDMGAMNIMAASGNLPALRNSDHI